MASCAEEGAVEGGDGHVRVLLLALEERSGVKIDPQMRIVSFMVEYPS